MTGVLLGLLLVWMVYFTAWLLRRPPGCFCDTSRLFKSEDERQAHLNSGLCPVMGGVRHPLGPKVRLYSTVVRSLDELRALSKTPRPKHVYLERPPKR